MLAYSISATLNSGLFKSVIVSSDDPEVGRIATWYGADFVRRPPELATDTAPLTDVAAQVIAEYHKGKVQAECLCQCMPNCPLVRASDIVESWRVFEEKKRRFQISVVPYRSVYPQWAVASDRRGEGRWLFDNQISRSQDLTPALCPTGAIWWTRVGDFLSQGTFYGSPFFLYPMNANRGIDIDDIHDLELAELLVLGITAKTGASPLEEVSRSAWNGQRGA